MIFEARIKCRRVANVITTYTAAVYTSVAVKQTPDKTYQASRSMARPNNCKNSVKIP